MLGYVKSDGCVLMGLCHCDKGYLGERYFLFCLSVISGAKTLGLKVNWNNLIFINRGSYDITMSVRFCLSYDILKVKILLKNYSVVINIVMTLQTPE